MCVLGTVARIVTGECGGVLPEAGPLVAEVAMNRWAAGYGFDGWHGIADVAADWTIPIAWDAVTRGGDPDGYLFALSADDVHRLQMPPSDWIVRRGRWAIAAYREWYGE